MASTLPTIASHQDIELANAAIGASDQQQTQQHDEASITSAGSSSKGHQVATFVREYCLSCLPPHIRRKGFGVPPLKVCMYVDDVSFLIYM